MHHRTLTPINACTNILGAVCFDDVNCCTAELPKITADTLQYRWIMSFMTPLSFSSRNNDTYLQRQQACILSLERGTHKSNTNLF